MSDFIISKKDGAVPIELVHPSSFTDWISDQPPQLQTWTAETCFDGTPGTVSLFPAENGAIAQVLFGVPNTPCLWDWASLPDALPPSTYTIDSTLTPDQANDLATAWGLAAYKFDRYKNNSSGYPVLAQPAGCDATQVRRIVRFTNLVRDLINTPAADMGPDNLAEAAANLANEYDADLHTIIGEDLLHQNFPAIYAVGRAHDRAPRLIDFTWGDEEAPKVTIIGKGVCFDTGGLNIKSSTGMKMMRKDMGGSAHALGLAGMIMDADLPIRLRVLIPAVENSISANAMRPGDILMTHKGLTVEVNNTDAEGRLVLADALSEASSENPDIIMDFATLTGAARIALGTELPALFCNDDIFADELLSASQRATDPLWRMPLWHDYKRHIEGKFADLNNSPDSGFGGAITAALFLEAFILPGISWAHVDVMAWNSSNRPGRPEGGESMGMRAFFDMLMTRYTLKN
ncbi:MAG: leucyl aminopeptidase [Rhodospirillaceae bacterium TMED8]|nr:leucyl aminopeptidase [Magnetovibrio sp.]OUT53350.1 MAG: leucyl aminopeptidase [Rhodospirillaceae bacterium TMED8]